MSERMHKDILDRIEKLEIAVKVFPMLKTKIYEELSELKESLLATDIRANMHENEIAELKEQVERNNSLNSSLNLEIIAQQRILREIINIQVEGFDSVDIKRMLAKLDGEKPSRRWYFKTPREEGFLDEPFEFAGHIIKPEDLNPSKHTLEEYKKRKVVPTRLKYEDYYKDNKKPSEQDVKITYPGTDELVQWQQEEPIQMIDVEKSDLENLLNPETNDRILKNNLREKYLSERFEPCETEGEGDNIRYL